MGYELRKPVSKTNLQDPGRKIIKYTSHAYVIKRLGCQTSNPEVVD